jgi:adhesin transport system outer membrane protein
MHHIPRLTALAAAALLGALAALPAQSQSLDATRSAAQRALQSSPDVTARLNAYLGKIEAQTVAAAGYKPRLDLNADVGTDRSQTRGVPGWQTINRSGAGLTLTQVLWDGLATRDQVTRAGHDRMGRWFDLVEASEQTALEATRAVYDVQRLRKLVALAEDNLLQHQQAATKLESRVRAGVGRGVDLDQARARLALAEANRDTELSNLHDVAARYQRVVGEMPTADMGAVELLKSGLPNSADEAVQQALSRSAAIAAGIEGVRAARASEAASRSAMHPQLSARANVGGGRNLAGVDGRKADASVELLLNWNLYNGGADGARAREQLQAVKQAMDVRDRACRDVRQTALVAYNDANKLSAQLNTLGRNSAAIERARDAYRQQFDIGQRSLLDLLNAENEAYTARRSLTNAVYDRAIAYARTLAAVTQLNVQLGLARSVLPADGANWTSAGDAAGRCPAVAVAVAPLRSGADTSLPLTGAPPAPMATTYTAPLFAAPAPGSALPPMTASPLSPAALERGERERERIDRAERIASERTSGAAAGIATVPNRVQAWARSWRNRDANAVNSFYAPGYKGTAASPAAWALQQKRLLAGKGELDLELEDVTVRELPGGQIEARFLQSMSTANGIEVHNTSQIWQQVGGQWRIVRERRL